MLLVFKICSLMLLFVNVQSTLNPYGENICLQTENYEEKIMVKIPKPKTEIQVKRCWDVTQFFKCKSKVTKWVYEDEPRIIMRNRVVARCCEGFQEDKSHGTKCIPKCSKGCVNGNCIAPQTCVCVTGFSGATCEKKCAEGSWGIDCANKCECFDNGNCNVLTGECECEMGWKSDRCKLRCETNSPSCKLICDCSDLPCTQKTEECTKGTLLNSTTKNLPQVSLTTPSSNMLGKNLNESQGNTTTESSINKISVTTDTNLFSISAISIFQLQSVSTEKIEKATESPNILSTTEYNKKMSKLNDVTEVDLIGSDVDALEKEAEVLEESSFEKGEIKPLIEEKYETDFEEESVSEIFYKTQSTSVTTDKVSITNSEIYIVTEKEISEFEINSERTESNKQEIDSLISNKNNNFDKKTKSTILYFLPTLSIFSGASFFIIIITAYLLHTKNRNRLKEFELVTVKDEKQFQMEGYKISNQTENFFWINNTKEKPVSVADVDLNTTTPVLETFKPK